MHASAVRRALLSVLLAIPPLLASFGCVPRDSFEIRFADARFNEHIAADLGPLVLELPMTEPPMAEVDTDMCYGFFRDGRVDPDGNAGPRTKGLLSEIYPVWSTEENEPKAPTENLVQAPCLFVARGDELRVAWEVVGTVYRGDEIAEKLIDEHHPEIGLCTYSHPENRLMFYDPVKGVQATLSCRGSGDGDLALTVPTDPEKAKNILNTCRWGPTPAIRLEAFAPRQVNADGVCPTLNASLPCGSDHFDGEKVPVPMYNCFVDPETGLQSDCELACGVLPSEDATYLVRIENGNPLGVPVAERWLRPNVLVVDKTRTLVRPMTVLSEATMLYGWQAEVQQKGGADGGPVRWTENYSSSVRVETVQIVSRDANGGDERVETPEEKRLTINVPVAGQSSVAVLNCTGEGEGSDFTFTAPNCGMTDGVPGGLITLTPTYLVSNLNLGTVTEPITWKVTVAGLPADRQLFIKFGVKSQTMGAGLRVSPALDLGRIPDTGYSQGNVEIENVGGEPMTITGIELRPGVWQPQDFSFFVVGDPIAIPLPIEAKPQADGSRILRFGDLAEVPILNIQEDSDATRIRIGDPAASPADPQPFTIYGEQTLLRGRILTRDDPSAVFRPSAASDPRPFSLLGYLEKQMPFVLHPGQRVTVAVEARPTAHGLRRATLRIHATPPSNPSQTQTLDSQLLVEALSGPILVYSPSSLYVYRDNNGAQPGHRTGVLFNGGHFDLTIQQIQVTGPGAARFLVSTDRGGLGPFLLPPGDAVDVRVEYLPDCDGTYGTPTSAIDHHATLYVTSNGGNASIPIGGASQGFCP